MKQIQGDKIAKCLTNIDPLSVALAIVLVCIENAHSTFEKLNMLPRLWTLKLVDQERMQQILSNLHDQSLLLQHALEGKEIS